VPYGSKCGSLPYAERGSVDELGEQAPGQVEWRVGPDAPVLLTEGEGRLSNRVVGFEGAKKTAL